MKPTPIKPAASEGVVRAAVERVDRAREIRWIDSAQSYLHHHPGASYQDLRGYARTTWQRDFQGDRYDKRLAEMDAICSTLWLNGGMPPVPTPAVITKQYSLGVLALVAVGALVLGGVFGVLDARHDVQACDFNNLTTCVAWLQEDFR